MISCKIQLNKLMGIAHKYQSNYRSAQNLNIVMRSLLAARNPPEPSQHLLYET